MKGATLSMIRLGPVSANSARDWLGKHGWDRANLEGPLTERYFQPGSFVLRPFYLSAIRELGSWGPLMEARQSLTGFLAESVVGREAKILAPSVQLPLDEVEGALNGFFEDMAEDMADRESEAVPRAYVAFLAEYSFEGKLRPDVIKRLVHSIHSMVLVEQSEQSDELRFPHTQVQARYLARGLARQLAEGRVPPYLGRTIFGQDRVEAFADRLLELPETIAERAVLTLRTELERELRILGYRAM